LGWAVIVVLTLASIVDDRGPARFRNPHVLTEPSAWLLHVLALTVFLLTVGVVAAALRSQRIARQSQALAFVGLVAIVVLGGYVGQTIGESVWGFPLADVVWTFDVLVLTAELVAFVLAIALGTPGCEIRVWGELIARARGEPPPRTDVLACIVGLHLIDGWESARRRGNG